MSLKKGAICVLAGCAVGIGIGYWISDKYPHGHDFASSADKREMNVAYDFINPLLACGDDRFPRVQYDELGRLEQKIETYLNTEKNAARIMNAAVYFRELNGVNSISINGQQLFTPGSMLKVPLVMSVYAKAENNPDFLSQKVTFDAEDLNLSEHFKSTSLEKGKEYSVEELINYVLAYSDNNAAVMLLDLLSEKELHDAYSKLGIKLPEYNKDYEMSVNVYASFFRILYNATYIDNDASEKILKILSNSTFKEGIVAGVPGNITVAHKFGERNLGESGVQLHDCGIVYMGKQPYLLCVMMQGKDYDSLTQHIAQVSKMAYEYASSRPR